MQRENKIATVVLLTVCLSPFAWHQYESWKIDHSKWLLQLVNPVHDSVELLHQTYKRYPTIKETVDIVNKAQCKYNLPPSEESSNNVYYDCHFKGEIINVRISYEPDDISHPYSLSFIRAATWCFLIMERNSEIEPAFTPNVSCRTDSPISFRQ